MKAIMFRQYGSPDKLKLEEIKKPTPKDGEVLIKVYASSINSWDWELLKAKPFINRVMFGLLRPRKINILGCDVAGTITAVGKNVQRFKVGDDVFGDLSQDAWGGFAEYDCAPETSLTLKPDGMTFEQAAAIPQAGLLALQGLCDIGQIKSRQKVLINGAGGGVGTFAIQIAKSYGAEVTGVDSAEKLELMRSVGADHVVDYTQVDFTKSGERYDLILDVMARHSFSGYKQALSSDGIFVMVGGNMTLVYQMLFLKPWLAVTGSQKMSLLLHKPNKGLETVKQLFEAGKILPVIDKCYALEDVPEALQRLGNGNAIGKLVITVNKLIFAATKGVP